jgi:hypothetical protein
MRPYDDLDDDALIAEYHRLLAELKAVSEEMIARANDDTSDTNWEDFPDDGDGAIDLVERF